MSKYKLESIIEISTEHKLLIDKLNSCVRQDIVSDIKIAFEEILNFTLREFYDDVGVDMIWWYIRDYSEDNQNYITPTGGKTYIIKDIDTLYDTLKEYRKIQ